MKTFIYSLFATLIFAFSGNAQKTESAELKITAGKTVTSYKYTSIRDFQAQTEPIMAEAVRAHTQFAGGDACMITITMSVTVTAGSGTFLPGGQVSCTVTGSITVACSQAVAAGIRLRDQLTQMAGGGN